MRAFVTGGTGFLGSRVVRRLLARGDEVHMLAREGRATEQAEAAGARVVRGDLSDLDPLLAHAAAADVVFHVGARMTTTGPWDDFFRVNVEAGQRLMDAALSGAARRFVHVSSLGIFDIPRDGMDIAEDSDYDRQPLLRGHYTRSKLDADRLACAEVRAGSPVVVVRPGVLFGPTDAQPLVFLGRVKKFLKPDILAVVSSPDYRVPLVYVENAADAVVLAGTAEGVDRGVFNVIDDPDLTQDRYFRTLSDVRPRPLRVVYLPVSLLAPAVRAADLLHRVVKRRPWSPAYQLLRSERSARYSTEAARSVLGWSPAVDLRTSLAETLRTGR